MNDRHLEHYRQMHHHMAQAVGDLSALLQKIAPAVLDVRTFIADANGQATGQSRIPYSALAVSHISAASQAAQAPVDSKNITGSATSPGAGATIAQIALPVGTFTVSWIVELSGTIAAAELNNFQLYQSGTGAPGAILTSINAAAANSYAQLSATITTTAADNFIKVLAVGAATAGAVYNAQMTALQASLAAAAPALYVSNAPPQTANPVAGGPGIAAMRNGGMIAVNLRGYAWTVYGAAPGDLITVTEFATAVPPVSS